jgi:hypothetical protein
MEKAMKKMNKDFQVVDLNTPENLEQIERLVKQIKDATNRHYAVNTPCGFLIVPEGETVQ